MQIPAYPHAHKLCMGVANALCIISGQSERIFGGAEIPLHSSTPTERRKLSMIQCNVMYYRI